MSIIHFLVKKIVETDFWATLYSKLIFEKKNVNVCFNIGVEIADFLKCKRSRVRY